MGCCSSKSQLIILFSYTSPRLADGSSHKACINQLAIVALPEVLGKYILGSYWKEADAVACSKQNASHKSAIFQLNLAPGDVFGLEATLNVQRSVLQNM